MKIEIEVNSIEIQEFLKELETLKDVKTKIVDESQRFEESKEVHFVQNPLETVEVKNIFGIEENQDPLEIDENQSRNPLHIENQEIICQEVAIKEDFDFENEADTNESNSENISQHEIFDYQDDKFQLDFKNIPQIEEFEADNQENIESENEEFLKIDKKACIKLKKLDHRMVHTYLNLSVYDNRNKFVKSKKMSKDKFLQTLIDCHKRAELYPEIKSPLQIPNGFL